jgi:succinate dehydrogenase / fumarate reductase cytochrome b subunit
LLVIALVLGHLFVMHYANAPASTTSAFVLVRWSASLWRDFDWVLLLLALTHGLVGMRNVIADSVSSRIVRRASDGVLAILAAAFLAIGSLSIVNVGHGLQTRGVLSGAAWIVPTLDALLGALALVTYLAFVAIIVTFVARGVLKLPIGWWQLHGQWAWALHRATGIGIFFFLLVHVLDLALLPLAPNLYDATVASYANPFLMPMEVALVGAVIYHALNGARLWILEFFDEQTSSAAIGTFACVVLATLVLVLPSIFVLVRGG